jgi:Uma2 family endonuclease
MQKFRPLGVRADERGAPSAHGGNFGEPPYCSGLSRVRLFGRLERMSIPSPALWQLDPEDPRAPSVEIWEKLSAEERAAVVATLPSEFPPNELSPPEGDRHYEAYSNARETLTRWYRERQRKVYISGNLPVYYPGERMFSPDVIAVTDVSPHARESWIVSQEGNRGLDFALEVLVSGRRRKDLRDNVERYARLNISEYFVYDRARSILHGYRLAGPLRYERLVPQTGYYSSDVLGLELGIEGSQLRFACGGAPLPNAGELIGKLGALVSDGERRALELEAALEEEQQRRDTAEQQRDAAEQKAARLSAELDLLKSRR